MNLSAPTNLVFFITVIIALLAVLATIGTVAVIPVAPFWLMTGAYVVLALGVLLKGI